MHKHLFVVIHTILHNEIIYSADDISGANNSAYTPGDVNGDGAIDAMDVNLVRRHIAGGYNISINTLAADVDADGYVIIDDKLEW